MKLQEFNWPEVTDVDIAFGGIGADPDLLKEAKTRGFYRTNTPYNQLFSKLFFNGGKINIKKGLDKSFERKALRYFKALTISFEPKHEEKEAICAMILSETAVI